MATNIEIKARLNDFSAAAETAAALSASPVEIIRQEDVFFPTPTGRLKLRFLAPDWGQLIFYERPDREGPKASEYFISETGDPASLRRVLARAYGERGVVKKERHLYLAGRTRIHLDKVEGLGSFLELEVMLEKGEAHADGQQIAEALMTRLGVAPSDLLRGAYIDLLEANGG
jgi:predicted adenylyl cyclase CyaB